MNDWVATGSVKRRLNLSLAKSGEVHSLASGSGPQDRQMFTQALHLLYYTDYSPV